MFKIAPLLPRNPTGVSSTSFSKSTSGIMSSYSTLGYRCGCIVKQCPSVGPVLFHHIVVSDHADFPATQRLVFLYPVLRLPANQIDKGHLGKDRTIGIIGGIGCDIASHEDWRSKEFLCTSKVILEKFPL